MTIFEINNLGFAYPERAVPALDGVSVEIRSGEFLVICGKSGCGKSTLLRHLKTVLTPFGERSGDIVFDGRPLASVEQREQAARIGFVLQSPDNQIVTDKVWHELAFGLESLGEKTPVIRRRVAEMASFFGIQEWYGKSVSELSGGQKQILALASVMAMQPDVLILDEPTSQLDPIAAEDFIETLKKINDEIGTTIILSEHRLEGALPRADRAVAMASGRVICQGSSSEVGRALRAAADPMLSAMPTPMRVYLALESEGENGSESEREGAPEGGGNKDAHVPETVREGRVYLTEKLQDGAGGGQNGSGGREASDHPDAGEGSGRSVAGQDTDGERPARAKGEESITLKEVWFRYERSGNDIVKDLSLTLRAGELACVVGGNGSGKTTMLGVITGENRHYRGKVRVLGLDPKKAKGTRLSDAGLVALPQNPQTLFTRNTVLSNLIDVAAAHAENPSDHESVEREVRRVAELTDTVGLLGFHPYDISGGEQQRAGLAMALLARPKLLLLDEPTKGMDSFFKEKFSVMLRQLCADGLGVLMVSHDVEFCAKHADRCMLFFNGGVVSEGAPRAFFSGNSFYTTAANRMSRGLIAEAITAEDVIEYVRDRARGAL
ncbi:MAG: ATP-binding cassette domain-containing protein [Clostridiales Family XIII bacterium]|jgi:energy-coupling factor transport system ATP-binding protein|nr:ATP-binding cassette domain-containing protein [Clostridiales Family XIII bacterium]